MTPHLAFTAEAVGAPKPAPGPTGFESVSPLGSAVAIGGAAILVLLFLVAVVLTLRAPRAGMEGKAQARRQLGARSLRRGATELRPTPPAHQHPTEHGRPAVHIEKHMGEPRCLATERR